MVPLPVSLRLARRPPARALYIHVPFCRGKCRYCDFYSRPGAAPETMERLVEAELRHLAWFKRALDLKTLDTVYIGGGTPSLLPGALLQRLLDGVAGLWAGAPAEWTVEANPDSLDEEFLDVCSAAGVTRLSVGVQTFSDRRLAFLGRPGASRDNRRALDLLARAWPGAVNLDLITGLPEQSYQDALADLTTLLDASPGHVSVYALTLERGTALHDAAAAGEFTPLPPEEEAVAWEQITARLAGAGYRQYEISNFARPGQESLHNLHYWRLDPYVGLGPSAFSTLPLADGRVVRLEAVRDLDRYDGPEAAACFTQEFLNAREWLLDHLLMGLRLEEGIDKRVFARRFGRGLDQALPRTWASWRERGLAEATETYWRCTPSGRLVLNALLREAAEELDKAEWLKTRRARWE